MKIAYFLNFYPTQNKMVAEDEMIQMIKLGHQIFIFPLWGKLSNKDKIPVALRGRIYYPSTKLNLNTAKKNFSNLLRFPLRYFNFLNRSQKYIGFKFALASIALAQQLKEFSVERIHVHFASNAAVRAMLISEFLSIPFSCTGHGSEILLYRYRHLKEIIIKARPFITISEYNRRFLNRLYNLDQDSIKVLHCGVDLDLYRPIRKEKKNISVILSVTWLRKAKGTEYLVEACRILKGKGVGFECWIVGGGGSRGGIEGMIRDKQLQGKVFLLGVKTPDEIRDLYQKADVMIMPSLSEGIPISLMEAMAMEIPVIATSITGIPELIDNGKNGILVEPKDSITLAQVIERLLKNPDLCKKLGRLARDKIEKDFNLKRNVKDFEQLLLNS